MRTHRLLLIIAITCLAGAWAGLFFHSLAASPWLAWMPAWAIAVLLIAAGGLLRAARAGVRSSPALWTAITLTAVSLAFLELPPRNDPRTEQHWRRESSVHVAETLREAGIQLRRLEDLSTALGARATDRLRDIDPGDRTAAFALLDSLAQSAAHGKSLASGTAIGLQYFDETGERVAWAGWPQSVSLLDRMFIANGTDLVYTRSVSLYHILSQIVPVAAADGSPAGALLVDMPLEVDYRVNNRFLKSSSLADHIPSGSVARVSFDYYPATGNLPERLPRLREQAAQEAARRVRMLDAAAGRRDEPAAGDTTAGGEPAPTRRDSVMTYFDFPKNVEPQGEIVGTAASGMQGRVLVRSHVGNPLINVTAVGHPFSHYLQVRSARQAATARVLALLALFAMFVQLMRWIPAASTGRATLARVGLFAAFMVALRYSLLSFASRGAWTHARLLDPSVFATPTLGGLLRSTLDLAVTAVFFVVLIYGLVRIVRDWLDTAQPGARRRAPAWVMAVEAVAIAGVLIGACELVRRLTNTVVVNANPRLLGDSMTLTDVSVVVLHVGIFLMVTGIVLAAAFLIWGLLRATGNARGGRTNLAAFALVMVAGMVMHRWDPVGLSALIVLFVIVAPRVVRREDLVSFGIVAFCLVVVSSASAYVYLNRDYDELRKSFVLEKSGEISNPGDNWKVVILEDVLGEYAQRHDIRQAMRNPSVGIERLAFDLWADSPFSLLGYSCAIHVVDAADSVISQFAVDMPYRARITEGGERTDTPDGEQWAVLDLTRSTPQGVVRFYRGILNVEENDIYERAASPGRLLGKVIIDVPFFFGSLELAARTGPRTPEVLRNVQEGGVAPRVEEPEALLLARVDRNRRVTESSSEQLAVGTRVSPLVLERAKDRQWPLLRSSRRNYRVVALDTDEQQGQLLAGFAVPSPARHLLRWSTLLSLYLFYSLVLIVAVLILGAMPRFSRILPSLTPGRRLGFQQKLLASFLVVALAPVVILGLFSVDFIKGRFVEESRDEASVKAFSARKAFVNILHGELQFYLSRADLTRLVAADAPPVKRLGGHRVAALFDDATLPDPGTLMAPVVGSIADASTEDLAVCTIDGMSYVGVFSAPLRVTRDGWVGGYYLYYGRAIDSDLLAEIAEQVGSDVNVYVDGELVASSREGLLAGGFISATMNAEAFVEVSLLGSERSLGTERAGSYNFQVAYLPVDHWRSIAADSTVLAPDPTRAALAVPLLFRPESYSLEVQRATSVILGLFALLLAATIALGLVVARGVFEPLRELVAGTRRISQGDFNVRLREERADEVGIVAVAFNEMTQRIAESQRALEERRRYLEAILESIGAGVISTDAEGRVRTVNSAAERITGVNSTDAIGRTGAELAGSGRAQRIFSLLDASASARPGFDSGEIEVETEGGRGTVKFMRTHLETEGRPFGTVLVFEDLTELIQSKKLSAWVEMARQIAHEIKNPLTPIRISTQFMRRAYVQKPEEFERIFNEGTETIIHQVDVLKRIAGEFSSFGRMQQLEVKAEEIDPLVRQIVTPYENNASGVRVHYDNGVADARVLIDAEAVRKICTNLIENALEAMGPQGGELRVGCSEATEDGVPVVRVVFRDTGPGLDGEAARRLFEPYFSTKTTGTGLGLAICRSLSRQMGGDVTIENVAGGKGAEATLTLRRA